MFFEFNKRVVMRPQDVPVLLLEAGGVRALVAGACEHREDVLQVARVWLQHIRAMICMSKDHTYKTQRSVIYTSLHITCNL